MNLARSLSSQQRTMRANVRNLLCACTLEELTRHRQQYSEAGDIRRVFLEELIEEKLEEIKELAVENRLLLRRALIFLAQSRETKAAELLSTDEPSKDILTVEALKIEAKQYEALAKVFL